MWLNPTIKLVVGSAVLVFGAGVPQYNLAARTQGSVACLHLPIVERRLLRGFIVAKKTAQSHIRFMFLSPTVFVLNNQQVLCKEGPGLLQGFILH